MRIHRSTLVALGHVEEVRVSDGRTTVRLGEVELPVSRRHSRDLRDRLRRRVSAHEAELPDRGRIAQAARRVRITHPRTEAARRALARPPSREIDEQTELGEVYMRSLIRSQRRLAIAVCLTVAVVLLAGVALAGAAFPRFGELRRARRAAAVAAAGRAGLPGC